MDDCIWKLAENSPTRTQAARSSRAKPVPVRNYLTFLAFRKNFGKYGQRRGEEFRSQRGEITIQRTADCVHFRFLVGYNFSSPNF